MELEKLGFLLSVWVRVWFGRTPALPRPQRCEQHRGLVSSPERWLSTFKGFGVVGDTGIEPVTSCVSCKRANQLRQSP